MVLDRNRGGGPGRRWPAARCCQRTFFLGGCGPNWQGAARRKARTWRWLGVPASNRGRLRQHAADAQGALTVRAGQGLLGVAVGQLDAVPATGAGDGIGGRDGAATKETLEGRG